MTADPLVRIAFRPLEERDLALLHRWLNEPHVVQTYGLGRRPSLEEISSQYLPRVRGEVRTRPYVLSIDDGPSGYVQTYRLLDHPSYAAEIGVTDEAHGMDLLIGDPRLVGRGIGSAAIRRFVEDVVFADPAATAVVADPPSTNPRSIGAFRKAGFRLWRRIRPTNPGTGDVILRRERPITVREESPADLQEHERIPIAFEVRRVLEVEGHGDVGEARLHEREIERPYVKDYDVDGGSPTRSTAPFDLAHWALLVARAGGRRVGGALLAFDTPGVDMLEGRRDLAVVWDLRVDPGRRRSGVGTALWRAAVGWAARHGCRHLKVETQDVNVPACRFYEKQGCRLLRVVPGAYPDHPHETQCLWVADVPPPSVER